MCERYSWIEKDGAVLFLTGEDVYDTKRGRELQRYCKNTDDYIGHGAIRFYFNCKDGIEKECTDFSTSDNFPNDLVKAIKAGKMRKLGCNKYLLDMLTKTALKKLPEICYAHTVYDKAHTVYDKTRTDYYKAQTAYDKAQTAYYKAQTAYYKAQTAYYKAYIDNNDKFWNVFMVKNNRKKCWR